MNPSVFWMQGMSICWFYDKVQSRSALYHLIYLSIQCGLLEEAERFYEDYKKIDHDSTECYILNFYIQKAKGANHADLIVYIKDILSYEYLEEWAYELAKLYHKEGMEEARALKICTKIILWFGEGIIVEKAMLLKLHYVEGIDISSPKAIDETRNLAAELRIAARIADRQERERYETEQEDVDDFFEDRNQVEVEQEEQPELELDEQLDEQLEVEPEQQPELEKRKVEHVEVETLLQTDEKSKKQQMIESIVEEAMRTRQMPHFSVIGNNEEKTMEITKKLMRELCEKGVLKTPRIARITAAKVNSINLEEKTGKPGRIMPFN